MTRTKSVSMEAVAPGIFNSEPGTALYEQKSQLDKIKTELLKFGLTHNQAKVYIYLGKYGAKTAPEVCNSLELPRTETYHILNTLQNLGVVTSECCQPTKFDALPLSKVIRTLVNSEKERVNTLLQNEKELVETWNKIPSFAVETNETKMDKLQMLQGAPQIHNKIKDMISRAKEEVVMLCSPRDFSRFYHADLVELLVKSPAFERVIISPSQTMPEITEVSRERIRILPTGKKDNLCFVIKDFDEALLFLRNANHPSHNVFAVWSNSGSMIDSLRALFDYSWEQSEITY
ncbi:MAG TPA: helix-turn-helix domain-containing protein [Nitrosopumilaceae archaeon]|nr:helix-turn-helix domain-containing protein [Nitrosopumilaceae archaeon]